MRRLTPKQEEFCQAYLATNNATEAYRRAYKPRADVKGPSLWRMAKSVMDKVNVQSRLAELRAPAADAAQLTLQTHLEKLAEIRDKALEKEQYAAATTAEVSRGKAGGLYSGDALMIQNNTVNNTQVNVFSEASSLIVEILRVLKPFPDAALALGEWAQGRGEEW